jgi:Ribonuclease G/E
MIKEMIVTSTALETKVAILEDDQLAELYIERNRSRGILGNIYKGKVTKVLPGMQSAFVNVGLEKDTFLYVSDFIEDTEEYDKVLTDAEDQVAKAMAEIEVQERPVRRDRKPERSPMARKARTSRRTEPVAPSAEAPVGPALESWFLPRTPIEEWRAGSRCPKLRNPRRSHRLRNSPPMSNPTPAPSPWRRYGPPHFHIDIVLFPVRRRGFPAR